MADFRQILIELNENLQILCEREARYGGHAPLELLNQIDDHRQAITLTEQALAGELTEPAWRKQLRPLLVTIRDQANAHPDWGISIGDVAGGIIGSIIAGGDVSDVQVAHGSNIAQASHGGHVAVTQRAVGRFGCNRPGTPGQAVGAIPRPGQTAGRDDCRHLKINRLC